MASERLCSGGLKPGSGDGCPLRGQFGGVLPIMQSCSRIIGRPRIAVPSATQRPVSSRRRRGVARIVVLAAAIALAAVFYERATNAVSLVRTGIGGRKVVIDGGMLALP